MTLGLRDHNFSHLDRTLACDRQMDRHRDTAYAKLAYHHAIESKHGHGIDTSVQMSQCIYTILDINHGHLNYLKENN